MTLFHVTDESGIGQIVQEGLKPQIGPRSVRLGERKAAIYFFKNREFVDDAVSGWLGDAFEPGTKLFCLNVELPDDFPHIADPNFGEVEAIIEVGIPSSRIKSFTEI